MQEKMLEELTMAELAAAHLDINDLGYPLRQGYLRSCVGGLIAEITQARGNQRTRIFSPLFGSFALLDQLGSSYINLSMPAFSNDEASGVKKALYYFCDVADDSDEINALYGLRNSLVHDASLLSRGREKKGKWLGPFHHFIFGADIPSAVEFPPAPWDGNLETLSNTNRTKVNQRVLSDMAINAVRRARQLLDEGNLGFCLEKEIEMYYRYLFHFNPSSSSDADEDGEEP
ncbi:MAG: hypothetical protein DI562_02000 [Stenotrophomonas acidaminiphila]|nr:MAG: hypothetical protein DI562_02000 [Stenotrophomonas acidaminiphila]